MAGQLVDAGAGSEEMYDWDWVAGNCPVLVQHSLGHSVSHSSSQELGQVLVEAGLGTADEEKEQQFTEHPLG